MKAKLDLGRPIGAILSVSPLSVRANKPIPTSQYKACLASQAIDHREKGVIVKKR
jgi:hypothetical protein